MACRSWGPDAERFDAERFLSWPGREAGSRGGIAAPRAGRGGKQPGSLSRRNARNSHSLSAQTGEEHAAAGIHVAETWAPPSALTPIPQRRPYRRIDLFGLRSRNRAEQSINILLGKNIPSKSRTEAIKPLLSWLPRIPPDRSPPLQD